MAKKMVSIKLDEPFNELLAKLAEANDRSQGQQVQHMIKIECARSGIEVSKIVTSEIGR